ADMRPGTNFVIKMHDALKAGYTLVLLLSEDSLTSDGVAAEWSSILAGNLAQRELQVIPIKVRPCTPDGMLRSLVYADLTGITDESIVVALLKKAVDPDYDPRSEPAPFPGAEDEVAVPNRRTAKPGWPQIAPLDIGAERHVVGRDDEVAQLRSTLHDGDATAITQGATVVKSSGGMGKSTLARYFAETYASEYYGLWWLPAENRQELIDELCKLADQLGIPADAPPEARANAALQRIAQDNRPWLLIYDNAIGPKPLENLIPRRDHIHVIVTTREGGWPEDKFKLLRTGELDFSTEENPAVALLMQEAKRTTDRAGARTLAETLGGLPLALVNAGAYLRNAPDVSFVAYAEDVQRAIAQVPPEGGDYPDSVFAAVSLSLARLTPEAMQIANILAFWAPEGLEPGVFEAVRSLSDEDKEDERFKPIPDDLWPILREEGAVAQAFAELARRSILERRGDRVAVHFAMHHLTGAVIRARLRAEGRAKWREAAAAALAAAYPMVEHKTFGICDALTPHVQALAGYGADSAAADYLYNQAAVWLGQMRQDLPALLLARAGLRAKKRRLHPLHRDIGAGYSTLGFGWLDLGRPVIAEKLLARAAEIAEQNPKIGDEDRATVFNNHGGALKERGRQAQAAGKTAEAAEWFRRAARRYQQALLLGRRRGDRRAVAIGLNNLGTLRDAQGRRAAAIRLGRITLKIWREVLAPSDSRLASSLHNLAVGLLETPDWRDAEPLLDEALVIRADAFAAYPRHPDRVDTAKFLACAALMRGDRAKAEAIVARYPEDLDLGKLEQDALNLHLRIKTDSGETGREALKQALDLMGLTGDDVRRILSDLSQPPDP
ncbi:MAG: toll/interleukin-1 receptor domain-containing protein, partial [SAR324 cluster bacterium]|nr:toll/interleukin-1 receptor domain-containing protein [SAR324 cluster bacterium]